MAATVESLIAAGIDADTARNIAPFVAPDHGQKHAALKAKGEAAQQQAMLALFGAGSSLTLPHYTALANVKLSRANSMKWSAKLGTKQEFADLVAQGFLSFEGGKYAPTAKAEHQLPARYANA